MQWALLHVFLHVGEAQAHPDRRPKPKPSQARQSQEDGSGWQVKRLKTFHPTCFYMSEKPGPSTRPKTKPNPSQARPSQTRPGDSLIYMRFCMSVKPMQAIATSYHMPGGPQEPPGHFHIRVFACRGRPGPSPDRSPSPAQAKPGQAKPGSNLVGPSHARPSQKAKAQDDNPRSGCTKSTCLDICNEYLEMCTHAQDTCFHVPKTRTQSPGGRSIFEFTCQSQK